MKENKISAVIITLNEIENMKRCLEALEWVDEIVVVDSGSDDGTVELAKSMNCRVFHRQFSGYGEQKRFAVECAQNDWILSVDADEVVSKELSREIQQVIEQDLKNYCFEIPRTLIFMGREMKFARLNKEMVLRLFHKSYAHFSNSVVHEKVETKYPVVPLKKVLIHYSYRDIHDYFIRFNKYTSYAAKEAFKKRKKVSALILLLRVPLNFLKIYILQLGMLDGYPGLIWSMNSAFYNFVKYAKLYELYLNDAEKRV